MESKEILLKGGIVLDPSRNMNQKADVRISDGKIAEIGVNLTGSAQAVTVPVEGCYVTPGLIDMHCHIYPSFPTKKDGLPTIHPEAHMFQSGVTTAVDAGTCGSRDFIRFREQIIDRSRLRILAFINIASGGMVSLDSSRTSGSFIPGLRRRWPKPSEILWWA